MAMGQKKKPPPSLSTPQPPLFPSLPPFLPSLLCLFILEEVFCAPRTPHRPHPPPLHRGGGHLHLPTYTPPASSSSSHSLPSPLNNNKMDSFFTPTTFQQVQQEEEEDIGSSSSSSSSSSSEINDDAASPSPSPLFEISSLMEQLPPPKKGLSKYFDGKAQSFASLDQVRCLGDLAKPSRKPIDSSRSCGGARFDSSRRRRLLSPKREGLAFANKSTRSAALAKQSINARADFGAIAV